MGLRKYNDCGVCVSSYYNCQECVVDRWFHSPAANGEVYDKNLFIVKCGSLEEVPVIKVWISDNPISADGKDTEMALVRLGCGKISLINEKMRNKDGKLTRFLTGRRFVFVNISESPRKEQQRSGDSRRACT